MKKLLTAFLLLSLLSSAQKSDTSFYSVVSSKTIAGEQKIWSAGPHEFHYKFYFNDRGRGHDLQVLAKTNKEGLITFLQTKGVDYYKMPYSQHFQNTGDSVVWNINGIRKSKPLHNQYFASDAAPGLDALLINWLLNQPGKKGIILPEGTMRTEEAGVKSLMHNGGKITLKLYALFKDSLPFPRYVWLTEEGNFFASVYKWNSIIQRGFEELSDTLFILQEEAEQPIYGQQIKQYAADVSSRLVITHANLFQSAKAIVKKDMTVEVVKGIITAIYPSAQNRSVKADTVINAKGKFLMPGLWDMHSHYSKTDGVWYLAGGVTHVRDMANPDIIRFYKKQIEANKLLGPDISFISGFIDKRGPYQGPTGKMVSSLDEAIKAVHDYKKLGYNQIKLYSSIEPEWVAPIAKESHKLGMRVSGHVPAFMTAERAVKDGYDELTHLNFLFLNFMGDTLDTRTIVRLREPADRAGTIDLKSAEVRAFIQLLKKMSVEVDPTMSLFAGQYNEFKGDTADRMKHIISWLPDHIRSDLAIKTPFGSEDQKERYRSSFYNMLNMLKLLHSKGITLLAGTDGGQAIRLHHELELYVKSGIPANEVLRIATYNAAKSSGLGNTYGDIEVGKAADFILIDGNPTKNISDVRRVEWVIKNHKLYKPKELLASQGWKYYY
jgi:hypothetical protein